MAKTYRSRKAKGNRLEAQIATAYRKIGIEARRMPMSGAMTHMKSDIFKVVPDGWHDEVKNQETVKLRDWWNQTTSTCGRSIPVLHISANYRPVITVMSSDQWYQLLQELKDNGTGYLHYAKKLTKKRYNLWDEWNSVKNETEYGDPVMHIENMDLTVISLEHYMEIRETLLNV
jgi:hypothetical protein